MKSSYGQIKEKNFQNIPNSQENRMRKRELNKLTTQRKKQTIKRVQIFRE